MGFGRGFAKSPQFRAHALEHLSLSSVAALDGNTASKNSAGHNYIRLRACAFGKFCRETAIAHAHVLNITAKRCALPVDVRLRFEVRLSVLSTPECRFKGSSTGHGG